MNVVYALESFPEPDSEWQPLFDEEGMEIRGKAMRFDWLRYGNIQRDGRLAFATARDDDKPIGYACGFIFLDLHWSERVAADDIWFVLPKYRVQGVGHKLKMVCHDQLKKLGAIRVYELVRSSYHHPLLMADCGYKVWGTRWQKDL